MYKYLIQAYNDTDYGPANEIRIKVQASDEAQAIERAKTIAIRSNYSVLEIEDLRGAELRKISEVNIGLGEFKEPKTEGTGHKGIFGRRKT